LYVESHRIAEPGAEFRLGLQHVDVRCQCVEAVADGRRLLRLMDPGGDGTAKQAMADALYGQAMDVLDTEPAKHLLVRNLLLLSIELFPGDPAQRSSSFEEGQIRNVGNYMSYCALARLEPERVEHWYRLALERCAALERYELGASLPPELEKEQLMAEVARIADSNLTSIPLELAVDRSTGDRSTEGGLYWVPSPIWEPGLRRRAWRALSVLPRECARYVFGPGTQDRLKEEPALQALVADVYARVRAGPLDGLVETREVRHFFLGWPNVGNVQNDERWNIGSPHRKPIPVDYQPHHKLLSTVMAEVCRYLLAGATLEELRAVFELDSDEAARQRAEDKLRLHREEVDRWRLDAERVHQSGLEPAA
jgi:hypothetical protein